MLDYRKRPGALDCIHAVTDIAGYLDTGLLRGADATAAAFNHFNRRGGLRSARADEGVYQIFRQQVLP